MLGSLLPLAVTSQLRLLIWSSLAALTVLLALFDQEEQSLVQFFFDSESYIMTLSDA
jgi:hypothetical protein